MFVLPFLLFVWQVLPMCDNGQLTEKKGLWFVIFLTLLNPIIIGGIVFLFNIPDLLGF